jgi:hypothetical protein
LAELNNQEGEGLEKGKDVDDEKEEEDDIQEVCNEIEELV